MEANELRIGNLVKVDSNPFESVTQIFKDGVVTDAYDVVNSFKDLEPIPLTEEWLVKFGFREELLYWVIDMMGTELSIIKESGSALVGLEHECGGTDLKIQHVHQLQNLYFALTGEELTIK